MIKSFRDKETENIFNGQYSRRLPRDVQRIAERRLIMLHRDASLNDLRVPPSNHLEALRGQCAGQHSIRVNDQWRVCFEWREEGVHNVEIVDYHGVRIRCWRPLDAAIAQQLDALHAP